MNEQLRIQPFGNEEYKVFIMGRADDRLSTFVTVGRRLLDTYAREVQSTLGALGYQKEHGSAIQDIAVAWYAQICGQAETPRAVFWHDDTKEETLFKLRDVACYQRWGKTINQYPKVQEIFPQLNVGVVAEDPIGFARGAAVRALISAVYGKETPPLVYFDDMRMYPIKAGGFADLLDEFQITRDDLQAFDPSFGQYLTERFNAALGVLKAGDNRPLNENPSWQQYIADWDDYQTWLTEKGKNNP